MELGGFGGSQGVGAWTMLCSWRLASLAWASITSSRWCAASPFQAPRMSHARCISIHILRISVSGPANEPRKVVFGMRSRVASTRDYTYVYMYICICCT